MALLAVGRIAKKLHVPIHRVAYAIKSRRIKSAGRLANAHAYDAAGQKAIAAAVKDIERKRK